MRNKITVWFTSIDLHDSRVFYNHVRDNTINISDNFLIKNIQTQLECNINPNESKEVKDIET